MNKSTKALLVVVGIVIIAGMGYMIGARMEIKRQAEAEGRKENIETIAVVNMDDGVLRENAQINYASQLMVFPDSNFVSVGLNDAKSGIQNGSYAAYIIIPENFSASVTSIEHNPQKVTLEYAYNPNLSEEAKLQAVRSVHNFNSVLNTNIAYMYVDAVLSAFHDIQDDSAEILSNDIKEMKLLQSVDAAKLIASMEHPELVMAEADVAPIELTAYIEQNQTFLTDMVNDYTIAIQKNKDNYLEIEDNKAEITGTFKDFFDIYQENIDAAEETQADILKEGQAELEESIGLYNKNITAKEDLIKQQISNMIDKQLAADQKQLGEIFKNNEKAYQDLQKYVQRTIDEQAEALTEKYQDIVREVAQKSYMQGMKDAQNAAAVAQISIEESLPEEIPIEESLLDSCRSEMAEMSTEESLPDSFESETEEMSTEESLPEDCQGEAEEMSTEESLPEDCQGEAEEMFTKESLPDSYESETQQMSTEESLPDSFWNAINLPSYKENSITVDWENPVDEKGKRIQIPWIDTSDPSNNTDTLTVCKDCEGKAMDKAVQQVVDALSLEKNTKTISKYIKDNLAEPLLQENLKQMDELEGKQEELIARISTYENKFLGTEAMEYLEQANLDTYLNDIANNTENMMGAVSNNNREYVDYAADIYRTTSSNMASLQTALSDAYTQTALNVKDSIDNLITSRENMNAQNVSLLKGFTELLTYTRVKSQGNPEVYDYIINPVTVYDHSAMADVNARAASRDRDFQKGQVWKVLGEFLLGVAIIGCMLSIVGAYRKYFYQKQRNLLEEREEVF